MDSANGSDHGGPLEPWGDMPRSHKFASSGEYFVDVQLWVPNRSANAQSTLRKPAPARKHNHRRDAAVQPQATGHDQRQLREKSSWMGMARGYGSTSVGPGTWRVATCKLFEERNGCTLHIYADGSILQHSVHMHLLRSTDIRPADKSLFFKYDCLGIHVKPGQGLSGHNYQEPIYIQFTNSDALNTWVALLRSYSLPETYGYQFSSEDGGLYRMWRQVELTVQSGRKLGTHRPLTDPVGTSQSAAGDPEQDLDVFCEILVDDTVCGRTSLKKGFGSPLWLEPFTFSDLPPFGMLSVKVWREKKILKPSLMGTIQVSLLNFRRGEHVEGWFPVLDVGPSGVPLQVGDVKMKVKVDEEIILPAEAYRSILQTIHSRNCLDLLSELEGKLRLEHIANTIVAVAIARNILLQDICELGTREVDGTPTSHNLLFRGNSVLTKTMELAMAWYGRHFLEISVGPVIRRMCNDKVSIEVDPGRGSRSAKDMEKNVELLVYWCKEFWKQIWLPSEMRKLFQHIRQTVESRYSKEDDIRWQSVSAFVFLRFIVPAVLNPHLFGLSPGLPPVSVARSLTLVAKVIQSIANMNPNVQKEEFMRGLKKFMQDQMSQMIQYISVVSTVDSEQPGPSTTGDNHDRLNVMNSLRERGPSLPTLYREAVPPLPHVVDIPKNLAVLTSAVVRSCRLPRRQLNAADTGDFRLDEFTNQCFEVERKALQCVNKLAAQNTPVIDDSPTTLQESYSPAVGAQPVRRRTKPTRPSTAPSVSSPSETFDDPLSRRSPIEFAPPSPSRDFSYRVRRDYDDTGYSDSADSYEEAMEHLSVPGTSSQQESPRESPRYERDLDLGSGSDTRQSSRKFLRGILRR